VNINKYCGSAGINQSSGIPNGYGLHYGWGKRVKTIGVTPDNTFYASMSMSKGGAYGFGEINFANLAGFKRAVSTINGTSLCQADINAIGWFVHEMAGAATVNADMAGLVSMVADLAGTSDVIAALSLISSAVCNILAGATVGADMIGGVSMASDISGSSIVNADINGNVFMVASILADSILNGDIYAYGNMSADIYVGAALDPLSPTSLAAAVWNALANEFNDSGSMGEKLNDAGSASNPWTETIEGTYTAEDLLKLISAVLLGKTTITDLGGGNATVKFRDVNDIVDRVDADMDGSERKDVTLDPT
jgi:hypothetical protein